jgi:hypothetical protein
MRRCEAMMKQCSCNHDAEYLRREIAARRWVHEYRIDDQSGEYVLVCLSCDGLWDHSATDRVIALVMDPYYQKAGEAKEFSPCSGRQSPKWLANRR